MISLSESKLLYHLPLPSVNSLPNDKILDFAQIERICRQQNKCDLKTDFCFGRVENIMGKGENAGFQHFLLFRLCFKRLLSLGH